MVATIVLVVVLLLSPLLWGLSLWYGLRWAKVADAPLHHIVLSAAVVAITQLGIRVCAAWELPASLKGPLIFELIQFRLL